MSDGLLGPPPLYNQETLDHAGDPDPYCLERPRIRRAAVCQIVCLGAEKAATLPSSHDRAIWLAQLAAWTPARSRSPLVERAIEALRETATGHAREKTRVFQLLIPIADEGRVREVAEEVMLGLPTEDELWEFKLRFFRRLNIELPPIQDLIPLLPNDNRRLDAYARWRFEEIPESVLSWLLAGGLDSFTDPNLRAAGCARLLPRLRYGTLDGADVGRMLALADEATDGVVANELLNYLEGAACEPLVGRVFQAKRDWNSLVVDPELRAKGFFSAINLGHSDEQNAELAYRGLNAAATVRDEAARAMLLGRYVWSIPGCPIWAESDALAIADSIGDQRLRAMAYGDLIHLAKVQSLTLEHGLQLTDEWARGSFLFEWDRGSQSPPGWDQQRWGKLRRDAAYAVSQALPRARYITILATETTGAERKKLAADAYEAAREITNPAGRAQAILSLVREGLIPRREQSEAVKSCWEIHAPVAKYRALASVSRLLSVFDLMVMLNRLFDDITKEAGRVDFGSLCKPPGLEFGLAMDSWWEIE